MPEYANLPNKEFSVRDTFGIDSDRDGNEFVLMVVMTAREKKALDRADGAYKAFLRAN